MNSKKIEFDITRKIKVGDSPFKYVIYAHKYSADILIEDLISNKSILTNAYNLDTYLRISNCSIPWKPSFNGRYIEIDHGNVCEFMPLYSDKDRFAVLTFRIEKNIMPNIRTLSVEIPEHAKHLLKYENLHLGQRIPMVDNSIPDNIPENEQQELFQKSYNYLYKNIKEFEIENFKLELVESETYLVDENFNLIKLPKITCRVPLFQLFAILIPRLSIESPYYDSTKKAKRYYEFDRLFMKIDNKFYRFPYGNMATNDKPCLGSVARYLNSEDSIEDMMYAYLVTKEFNGDYVPNLKFNKSIQTTLNIEEIRKKVSEDNFEISFIDALFYLSQCNSIDEINKNIFLFTPNVPKEIIEIEEMERASKDTDPENNTIVIGTAATTTTYEYINTTHTEFVVPINTSTHLEIPADQTRVIHITNEELRGEE